MRLARRLAPFAALSAVLAAVALWPALASASVTCTTAVGGTVIDRPTSTGLLAGDQTLGTGCAAALLSISPSPAAPGATVTLDGSGSVGSDTNPIAHYQWDYGDGGAIDVTDPPVASVTHVYPRGSYIVTLTILDAANAVLDTTSVPLVADTSPVASLIAPSGTLRPGATYNFDASGSSAPDSGASIVRYDWDWGDGTTTLDGGPTAQHAFATDGASRQVSVTVFDDLGSRDTATAAVSVMDELPLVQLIASPSTVLVGQQLTLNASGSSDPDGWITEYRWDLDANGSFETSTGLTPSVTAGGYPNPGPLYLRVKVIDDSGEWSIKGVMLTIESPPSLDGGGSGSGSGSGGSSSGSGSSGGGSSSGSGTGSGSGGTGGTGGTGSGFSVDLGGPAIQKLKKALRRGVGLKALANRAATGTLKMSVSARDARRLHLSRRKGRRPVVIGKLRLSLSAGRTAKRKIKLTRRAAHALRHARTRSLRVTIRGSLAASTATAAVVRVVLLRR